MPHHDNQEVTEEATEAASPSEKQKKTARELVSDDEIEELIRPELLSLNIYAILEIVFGLFLLFIAIIKLNVGWHLYDSGINTDLGMGFLAEGSAFIFLMFVSFIVAYGLIMKKKFAPIIGAGKGLFFIVYFSYGISFYNRLIAEVEEKSHPLLGDLRNKDFYVANVYVNILLLVFVVIITLSMFLLLYREGYFDKLLKKERGRE